MVTHNGQERVKKFLEANPDSYYSIKAIANGIKEPNENMVTLKKVVSRAVLKLQIWKEIDGRLEGIYKFYNIKIPEFISS